MREFILFTKNAEEEKHSKEEKKDKEEKKEDDDDDDDDGDNHGGLTELIKDKLKEILRPRIVEPEAMKPATEESN